MILDKNISSEPVYTIGVASSKLGVSVHSLRQYENEGLILTYKTETGRRLFSDVEIQKVKCIKNMIKEEGLNFMGIKRMLALIPCWKLRKCDIKKKKACMHFKSKTTPCWASKEKCAHPLPSCRECPVYRSVTHCDDLPQLLFK